MKSNYFKNIAGTAIIAFSLILGISSITAAQSRDPYQSDRYRRQQDELRRQQAEQLRRDQQDRARRDQNDQRNRGRDQQDQWGRDQNSRGRGRGGDGYPNWGGNYELRQTALNAGYNEGAKQGRNDRNRNRGYGSDFRNNSSYRNATKDYNSRFGDRELYRRYFQMAFENGYADGLRGY
jgi:hypothetical protein